MLRYTTQLKRITSLKRGEKEAQMWPNSGKKGKGQNLYMYGKKIKKKIKIIEKKVSFCTFDLEVLVYNNKDCQNVVK